MQSGNHIGDHDNRPPGNHIGDLDNRPPGNHIRYLRRQEIDIPKWDACMAAASNGLIYGFSFYLDHMTDGQWDALVLEDYSAIMPLAWRRRAGIRYLYQPSFTQQGGIFARGDISPSVLTDFLDQLDRHFRFAEIFLNYANPPRQPDPIRHDGHTRQHEPIGARANFILPLDQPYRQLAAGYKENLVRILRSAAGAEMDYAKEFDLKVIIDNHRREYEKLTPHVKEDDYRRFEKLCLFLQPKGQMLLRVVTGPQQELLAAAILFRDAARLYLLQSSALPAGRELGASHFLLDNIIKEWAESRLILDFEGSDLPGVARFYQNFGSRDQPYFFYRYNKLPWPLRLLKK